MIPVAKKIGGTILQQQQSSEGDSDSLTRNHIDVPVKTNVTSASLEDILEVVTRGYVKNCGPLNALCQEANFYQLYSREYVQQLGDYLLERTAARRLADDTRKQQQRQAQLQDNILEEVPSMSPETVVLDIGAGDGVLMHCLRDYMERKVMGLSLSDNRKGNNRRNTNHSNNNSNMNRQQKPMVIPTMVATDDMSWRIFAKAEVEKLTVEQALEKYTNNPTIQQTMTTTTNNGDDSPSSEQSTLCSNPDQEQCPQVIVLCSWMPMGQDWTSQFRTAQVDEYILIGEADDGSCGDNWLTWGNRAFYDYDAKENNTNDVLDHTHDDDDDDDDVVSPTPPYVMEGYQRWDMDASTKYQFSSFDLANSKSSKTVSFRRKKKNSLKDGNVRSVDT